MTREDARELMPLFAVDALDPETRAELLTFVEGSPEARQELEAYLLAVNAMAQDVPQVRPRPELRQRIMAAVTARDAVPAPGQGPSTPEPHAESTLTPPVRPTGRRWAPWLIAAASVAAVVSSVGLFQARGELEQLRRTLAVWQARAAEAERNLGTAGVTLAAYQRQLDVMTADDVLLVNLSGAPPAAPAQARAFLSRSRAAIVFTARGLPRLPDARVYQLWAVARGGQQVISVGTFEPDARGRSQVVADVPALQVRPDALAVTIEPAGGVPAPTGPKVLVGAPAN